MNTKNPANKKRSNTAPPPLSGQQIQAAGSSPGRFVVHHAEILQHLNHTKGVVPIGGVTLPRKANTTGNNNNTALLPYPAVSRNPGQFSDNDGKRFEDVTGLPTHYDQCYKGWKGNGFNGNKNGCILGGQYVIPMYQNLYLDGAPVIMDSDTDTI